MNFEKIREVFKENGVPLSSDDVWKVQGTPVVKHKALERLSAAIKVQWEEPKFIRCERGEAVIYVAARRLDKQEVMEWSIGEALIAEAGKPGSNYKVSGNQASYVWAMAEKRGKDRVIIKLAGLHGAYSEEEADEFKNGEREYEDGSKQQARGQQDNRPAARQEQRREAAVDREEQPPRFQDEGNEVRGESRLAHRAETDVEADLKRKVDGFDKINDVTDFMLDKATVEALNAMDDKTRESVRDYAKARLHALGWPPAKNRGQSRPGTRGYSQAA